MTECVEAALGRQSVGVAPDRRGAEEPDAVGAPDAAYAQVQATDGEDERATVRPLLGFRSAQGLAAWMLVPPVDALMLVLPLIWAPDHAKAVLLMAAVSILLLFGAGRYRARLHLSVLDDLPTLLSRLLAAGAVVGTLFALTHEPDEVAPFLILTLGTIGMVVCGRILTTQLLLLARKRRIVAHRTVLVGGAARSAEMATLLRRYPQYGLLPVAFVDDAEYCPAGDTLPHLGGVRDLPAYVAATGADVILLAEGDVDEATLLDVVRRPECADCDLLVIPRMPQFYPLHGGQSDHIGCVPVTRIRSPRLQGPAWAMKRAFDVVVCAFALVLLSPLLAVCALAVRLDGGSGVLFRQRRVGRHGHEFSCVKFRSMRPVDTSESATRWSIADDDRVSPVGRVMRRLSFDELPQLWNVMRGDMTLVGPRPERPHFVDKFSAVIERYDHRHRVRAGLTGLAQVSGLRGDTPIGDRARFDNYYIENWSLWLDAKVLLRTATEILFARGR